MADQVVRYVVYIDGQGKAISTLQSMEGAAVKTEASIAALNTSLRGMAGALGVGLGVSAIVSFGKDAVQGAADYETAVKRIKFASASLSEGDKNIDFINQEVDKFKIPLQQATEDYGKFLAQVAGTDMASDQVRRLHDELLLIGKVKGLDMGQLSAGVMNLGKMLEAGAMDARHLRPLEQQLSGIGKFIANEMGVSLQQLAILRNKGKLTGIDPEVLIKAIQRQSESLKGFLPEATTTIQSQLNELDNSWLRFKNDLVMNNLPELKALFGTLKEGVAWLEDHKSGIKSFGEAVIFVGGAWLTWKATLLATNGIIKLLGFSTATQTGAIVSQAEATAALNTQLALLNENLELIIASGAGAATSVAMLTDAEIAGFGGAAGFASRGLPINMKGASTVAAEEGAAIGATGASIVTGAVLVALVAWQLNKLTNDESTGATWGQIATSIGQWWREGPVSHPADGSDNRPVGRWGSGDASSDKDDIKRHIEANGVKHLTKDERLALMSQNGGNSSTGSYASLLPKLQLDDKGQLKAPAVIAADKSDGKHASTTKISAPTDNVVGQHVINNTVNIKEIIGQKVQNQNVIGDKGDTKKVAEELEDIILSITNDSQIRSGN